jgi:hypothetical protein
MALAVPLSMLFAPHLLAVCALAFSYALWARRSDLRFLCRNVVRTHDEYFAVGHAHNALGDGAEKEALNATSAVGSDNNQLGLQIGCKLGNFSRRCLAADVGDEARERLARVSLPLFGRSLNAIFERRVGVFDRYGWVDRNAGNPGSCPVTQQDDRHHMYFGSLLLSSKIKCTPQS